jgi:hypothetical protein
VVPVILRVINGQWTITINGIQQDTTYPEDEVEALVGLLILDGSLFEHEFGRILAFANKISEDEYVALMERLQWCIQNKPDDPCLHPTKPIDLRKMPPI